MQSAGGEGAPDIQELIDALLHGEPGQQQEEDPLAFPSDKSSPGHSAGGGQGVDPDMDEEGFIHGRATEFATKKDLADWSRNHSLKTGDNGIGAFGHNTAGDTPGVAVPSNWLRAKYGSTAAANGKTVTMISPTGVTKVVPILDVGPIGGGPTRAAVEVNDAAKKLFGIGDSHGWRYKMND